MLHKYSYILDFLHKYKYICTEIAVFFLSEENPASGKLKNKLGKSLECHLSYIIGLLSIVYINYEIWIQTKMMKS
jgi:hypothetical protein